MEKERRIKVLSLAALIVAVLGLTVAFAALSQTLTINGSANVDASEWDVHFEGLTATDKYGDAEEISAPNFSETTISNINVKITKPEDEIGYVVNIVNNGTVKAKVSSIEISKLCTLDSPVESCDWNNDGVVTQEDVDMVNDNISFFVCYASGKTIKEGDILLVNKKVQLSIDVYYGKTIEDNGSLDFIESTELPKRDLTFSDLSVTINYVQAD